MTKPRTRATFYPDTRDNRPECVAIIDGKEVVYKVCQIRRTIYSNTSLPYLGTGKIKSIGGVPQKNNATYHFWGGKES